jgi:hypothetical protein
LSFLELLQAGLDCLWIRVKKKDEEGTTSVGTGSPPLETPQIGSELVLGQSCHAAYTSNPRNLP